MKYQRKLSLIILMAVILAGCGMQKNETIPTAGRGFQYTFTEQDVLGSLSDTVKNEIEYMIQNPPPAPATVKNMLSAAIEPVGRCLYVWGGGWNEEDTAAGIEAMTLGASPRWYEFFSENDRSYNFKQTRYQIHDGLDCSGYVGYVTYQIFEDEYSDFGYVFKAGEIPGKYQELFGGEYYKSYQVSDYQPCDIMGKSGHVFIVIGQCDDGSVLFMHASPPALSLCGTPTPGGRSESRAVILARQYMSLYRSECYSRYDNCSRDRSFLTGYNQFRWDPSVLSDPDGYRNMSVEEILADLFEE